MKILKYKGLKSIPPTPLPPYPPCSIEISPPTLLAKIITLNTPNSPNTPSSFKNFCKITAENNLKRKIGWSKLLLLFKNSYYFYEFSSVYDFTISTIFFSPIRNSGEKRKCSVYIDMLYV